MKAIKKLLIIVFLSILLVPIVFFNFQSNYKSEIDNRMLTENPLENLDDTEILQNLGAQLSAYVDDRIGFRNEAVSVYNSINNSLFRIMEHPYYMKGQNDYIFIRKNSNVVFSDFHKDFAEMIVKISDYCKERDVPFLFVFEPEKLSVMREYAPVGMNYDNSWVDEFIEILKKGGVKYVNNNEILTEKYKSGISVFNKQYDAGHWNDIGAFFGVNNILNAMKEDFDDIHINTEDEFDISEELNIDLQQSSVLVEEYTPKYTPKEKPGILTKNHKDELRLDSNYHYFYHTKRTDVSSPKTLMFQGSYMNTRGYKFMANALEEYIAVHDYQNIFNFEYYYNLFQPEYVIFEVAEYTFLDLYFDTEKLQNFGLSPEYEAFSNFELSKYDIDEIEFSHSKGKLIDEVEIKVPDYDFDYLYVKTDNRVMSVNKIDDEYLFATDEGKADKVESVILIDKDNNRKYIFK